jgi:hypothetical protein
MIGWRNISLSTSRSTRISSLTLMPLNAGTALGLTVSSQD